MSTDRLALAPYGYMNNDLRNAIRAWPYPQGYVAPEGKSPEQAWEEALAEMAGLLAKHLWPRWTGTRWDGAATEWMVELTDADLSVMKELRPAHLQAVRQQAGVKAPLATGRLHASFFRVEDDPAEKLPVFAYLTQADRSALVNAAGAAGLSPFDDQILYWMDAHCTAPTLPVKDMMQRPRPYQVASCWNVEFTYERAVGAVTSALPSGHCIQGLLGVCSAVVELDGANLSEELLARLRQYAVDHGDRRVFAGVHYPGDNLASWCLCLYLCEMLYGQKAAAARRFIAQAVTDHSLVFKAIKGSGHRCYGSALDWFGTLAA